MLISYFSQYSDKILTVERKSMKYLKMVRIQKKNEELLSFEFDETFERRALIQEGDTKSSNKCVIDSIFLLLKVIEENNFELK